LTYLLMGDPMNAFTDPMYVGSSKSRPMLRPHALGFGFLRTFSEMFLSEESAAPTGSRYE
jgi:hypothetical protein